MEMTPVRSTDLRAVGYDVNTQTLQIDFNSGGRYQYVPVPRAIFMNLMAATSHGTYFHQYIKDRYPTRKIL